MILLEAAKSREGAMYLGGAAVTFLVVALTGVATVRDYQHQWALREAVRAFEQGQPQARKLLNELRNAGGGTPHDQAAVRVMLASYEYDRSHTDPQLLDTAERLFQEAHELDSRDSAAIGLACIRLTRAEVKDPDARHRDADAAISDLDGMLSDNSPDAEYLRGASLVLQGKFDKALGKLDDATPSQAPTREGVAARHWNLGVARLLAGNPEAGATFAMGYLMRPFVIPREFTNDDPPKDYKPTKKDDPARILTLAWRASLAKPPQDPAAHKELCTRARGMLSKYYRARGKLGKGQHGRFLPRTAEAAGVLNALGIGFFNAGDYTMAAEVFEEASKLASHKEPLFLQNRAWAEYQLALQMPDEGKEAKRARREQFDEASASFEKICKLLARQKGREAAIRLARTNAAAIRLQTGNAAGAASVYERYVKGDPSEAEWRRNLGALCDHRKQKKKAIKHYRKAIELQHVDSADLRQRVGQLGG